MKSSATSSTTSPTQNQAIPEAACEVLTLFEERAEELSFPDVNAEILQHLADGLRAAQEAVETAEAVLSQAREAERSQEEELLAVAKRAFAYARVYAETDPELAAKLKDLEFARSERGERKERVPTRRRKSGQTRAEPQNGSPSAELPFDKELVAQA